MVKVTDRRQQWIVVAVAPVILLGAVVVFLRLATPGVVNPELRADLLAMADADRDARNRWLEDTRAAGDVVSDPQVEDLDRKHSARLADIVDRFGWPGASMVGTDGAHAAWLLVQHANLAFQIRVLALMKELDVGEVAPDDLALLTDRVLVRQNQPQIYGSQLLRRGDTLVPTTPIRDFRNVDKRRRSVGLSSYEENFHRLMRQQGMG